MFLNSNRQTFMILCLHFNGTTGANDGVGIYFRIGVRLQLLVQLLVMVLVSIPGLVLDYNYWYSF